MSPTRSDLAKTGGADYDGNAIGTVANNLDGNGWKTYTAAGDMDMHWNFANARSSTSISPISIKRHIDWGRSIFHDAVIAPGVVGPTTISAAT